MEKFDFSGWATKNDLKCSDGRIIRRDAFKHCDGMTVPLVWNHDHSDPYRIIGHALLENRADGVYTYGTFNDTDLGQTAKLYVQHGDITQLSIYANQLKQQGPNVMHGSIREVSLVMAGANPGAFIESVMAHGEETSEEAVIYTGEDISLTHSDEEVEEQQSTEQESTEEVIEHSEKEDATVADEKKQDTTSENEKTVKEVFDEMSDEQKNVVYAMIGMALEDAGADDDSEGGEEGMKHNVFESDAMDQGGVLTHADQSAILEMAKRSSVGSFREAIRNYAEENGATLAHGIDEIETLFPDLHNINPGAPELIRQDQSWVMDVINKIHKSPFSRIKTRQADARIAELRAKGYNNREEEKTLSANIKLLGRDITPQTVYRKDTLHRDDIIDITDFDVVEYQWSIMKDNMYEELALAALVGDGRDDGDPDKIKETHIRSIWNDEELYTIHRDVDIESARAKIQGTNTEANFSENYIYAEAMIEAALYSREKFKGSGTPDLYCAPHLVNIMLLARDLNGRRIYDSKADLAKALNVGAIHEIEQLEDKVRTTKDGKQKKLLGLFVNLADYTFGSTKGGELTKFEDFDIDFNSYKYLLETRLCGTLTKPFAAIALEEPVVEAAG